MNALRALAALGPIDAKSAVRDPLLRWMLAVPVGAALLIRWGLAPVSAFLLARLSFDLAPYQPLVFSVVLLMMPGLFGMVIGFLLLDQRDDRTLEALQVTPLTLRGYLAYRIALPMALGAVLALVCVPLSGAPPIPLWALAVAALAAAPLAPIYALFLAGFAANKVQGFALSKAMGVVFVAVVVAYLLDSSWQYALGVVLQFWLAKLYWLFVAGAEGGRVAASGSARGAVLILAAGLAYQFGVLWLLLRRFDRVAHR